MGFNKAAAVARLKPKSAVKESPALAELSADERGYRDRARAEGDRRKLATDADYSSCLCFRTADERERFVDLLGLDLVKGRYIFAEEFRAALERAGVAPYEGRLQKLRVPRCERVPNPVESVEWTGDPETYTMAQFFAIRDAFLAREDKESYSSPYDSPYWVCVIARCREDRDRLLRDYGWLRYGAGFVSGSAVLRSIERR